VGDCPNLGSCGVTTYIPTRNSAEWIGVFLKAYRELGVEPLYVVDVRSTDSTAEILKEQGAKVLLFQPDHDFAEAGMVEFASFAAGTPWVLRMDDDEFPSRALLRAIPRAIKTTLNDGFLISRQELFRRDGEIYQSRAPGRLVAGIDRPSVQLRLYRPDRVKYIEVVHTSGFIWPDFLGVMAASESFAHFDRLMRSPVARLAKIEAYRAMGYPAYELADEYLPELFDLQHHAALKPDLHEFHNIMEKLPRPSADMPEIDPVRLAEMRESSLAFGRKALNGLDLRNADEIMRLSLGLPPSLYFRMAELLCTFGVTGIGERLWNFANDLGNIRKVSNAAAHQMPS